MEKPNPLIHIFIWKTCCVSAVDFLECWLANTIFGMQLIHRVGEHYLNFNLLFKMMLNCYCFKGFSGHLRTHCRQWSCSLVSKSNWIDIRQLKQWLLKSLRWIAKKYVLLSNLVSLFETLPPSLLGLSLLTDLFIVKAPCFNTVKEFIHSVWFDMITLLLKKLHASENTRLIVEEEWRVKVMSDVNSFVPTSNLPQFKLLKSHPPEHLFLQWWVFPLWFCSLATKYQPASRLFISGHHSMGCD